MVRASVAAERVGLRSVSIVTSAFAVQARPIARALGGKDLVLAEYPGHMDVDSEEEFHDKVAGIVVNRLLEGLATSAKTTAVVTEPQPTDIVFVGSLKQVQQHFHQNSWTDGLPIIPPTLEEVQGFLRFTDRSPDDMIGTLLPGRRAATVWNVAVNGVMAGCRPEYMPILIAIVEAMCEPEWRVEDAGSTRGWEPLVIVNGPIVRELNFNYGSGTMRVGSQSNTSIGRFARLYMRNVAGLQPGTTDKGVIGYTFNVALAENEDAVAAVGWQPFSAERGFAAGDNLVTVQSVVAISLGIYPGVRGMNTAAEIARRIAQVWGNGDLLHHCCAGMYYGKWYPLIVVTPAITKVLAREGWTKDHLKQYLYENVRIPAWLAEEGTAFKGSGYNLRRLVEEGRLPKEYAMSADPERLVPVFRRPEWIGVVVSGDPEVPRARGYTNNHMQGPPVSKLVKLPANWKQLLDTVETQRR